MFSAVLKDPIRGLKEIYESVRNSYTKEMDRSEELLFLSDFPAFRQIKPALLRRRRQVIPADPKLMTDLNIDLKVFKYTNNEELVKGDQVLSDGRRIILFSTNEHLELLARAPQILGDGTFRITPRLWTQTFIISAQVHSEVFVPVAFCLLPDKKKESRGQELSSCQTSR